MLKQEFEDRVLVRLSTFRATLGTGTARLRHSMFLCRMILGRMHSPLIAAGRAGVSALLGGEKLF
jgi:hypothetical protein